MPVSKSKMNMSKAKRPRMIFPRIERELLEAGFKIERSDLTRPWGGFFVIEESQAKEFVKKYYPKEDLKSLTKGGRVSPKILIVAPGKRLSWQYHHRRSEVWKLIKGEAGVMRSMTDEMGDEVHRLKIGEKVVLEQGERHRLVGLREYGIIAEIWQHTDPDNLSDEDDIVRVQDDFKRK